jgi:GNAT superfamily N-acetyltransferase
VIRSVNGQYLRPLPSSGFHDCSQKTAFGCIEGYVCDLIDESWEDYLNEMGVRTEMIEAIRRAPLQRVAVLRGLEINPDDRGEGHGHKMVSNLLDTFEDLGATITLLFADMEECNAFDLTRWYARYGFEHVDDDKSAPCMMIAGPEILAEVCKANGYGKAEMHEFCEL